MMKMMIDIKTSAALVLLSAASPSTAAQFFLKDRDKIVIMGDSITAQHMYSRLNEPFAAIRKALVMQSHQIEILPIQIK